MADSILFSSQDEITRVLGGIKWRTGNIGVYEGQFDDDELFAISNSQEGNAPFIVANFAGSMQAPQVYHGVTGARFNTSQSMFTVQVVYTEPRITRRVLDQINAKLIGFSPEGCGEVCPGLYASPGKINALGTPTRYSAVQSYTYYFNSNAVC